jgi:hypothetical protein
MVAFFIRHMGGTWESFGAEALLYQLGVAIAFIFGQASTEDYIRNGTRPSVHKECRTER